ncbi:MAG: maleylpyruvate isomerase N-terminal domain-containing protein [Anaerolineae bacterium]|nr:maleylpyruvate isomerase N-terminal domain-containing protein [Anaerolineae bacterium]
MSDVAPFRRLIEQWLAAYDALFAALDALPPVQRETPGLCGEWSARQLVAHLAGWHYEAIRRYAEIVAGDIADRSYDTDAFNALQVEARAHLTWEQTLDDLREAMDIFRAQALNLPGTGTRDFRYAEWLRGLTADAETHRAQVLAWLA